MPVTLKPGAIEFIPNGNPKQRYGDLKAPMHLSPPVASVHMAEVFRNGADKYGAYNWRTNPVELMTYLGAIMRHAAAVLDGEWLDPESGKPHLAHVMASAAIPLDADACGTLNDNRPQAGRAGTLIRTLAELRKLDAQEKPE